MPGTEKCLTVIFYKKYGVSGTPKMCTNGGQHLQLQKSWPHMKVAFFNVLHKKFQLMEESHTLAHLLYEESVIITGSPIFKSQVKISKPKICNKSECALSPKNGDGFDPQTQGKFLCGCIAKHPTLIDMLFYFKQQRYHWCQTN
jgi:hypothetical protein